MGVNVLMKQIYRILQLIADCQKGPFEMRKKPLRLLLQPVARSSLVTADGWHAVFFIQPGKIKSCFMRRGFTLMTAVKKRPTG
jgi:hypothetical protein